MFRFWKSRRERLLEEEIETYDERNEDKRGAKARKAVPKPTQPPAEGTGVTRADDRKS